MVISLRGWVYHASTWVAAFRRRIAGLAFALRYPFVFGTVSSGIVNMSYVRRDVGLNEPFSARDHALTASNGFRSLIYEVALILQLVGPSQIF